MLDLKKLTISELAATIAEHLDDYGIHVVLVGGLAVEIYTDNLYLTKDIDMVNINYQSAKEMSQAMGLLGFRKDGRVYKNDTIDIVVEFPTAPLSVGDELIHETTYKIIAGKRIPILTSKDVVKDRLAAFIHWRDNSSLIQAVAVMLRHQLVPSMFQGFCKHEGNQKQYDLLNKLFDKARLIQIYTMIDLEIKLTEILFEEL
jgi:hypothetical protein